MNEVEILTKIYALLYQIYYCQIFMLFGFVFYSVCKIIKSMFHGV